jgi:hypothetical protein
MHKIRGKEKNKTVDWKRKKISKLIFLFICIYKISRFSQRENCPNL